MAHRHRIVKCKQCGIIEQCRCPDLNKAVELLEHCEKCKPHLHGVPETEQQRKTRIMQKLSADIIKLGDSTGQDNQVVGVAVYGWLVDARLKIEELESQVRVLAMQTKSHEA